jgi:DNA-binding transcriptional MerR regulator
MEQKTAGIEKRLYTLKEAAESLGVCTKSVRGLVKRGLLKPIKRAFHKFLFTPAELDRFIRDSEAD